jgi:hypothetical protein
MADQTDFRISRVLSYLLHPMLIPSLVISVLMFRPDLYPADIPVKIRLWFVITVFIYTAFIPIAGVLILLRFRMLQSVEQNERSERTLPLLLASISYTAMLYTLGAAGVPAVFRYLLYSAAFALFAGMLINLFWKISLHTLGWGALTASLFTLALLMGYNLTGMIAASVFLSGLAGYARLNENAHSPAQVYLGFAAGVMLIAAIALFQF